MNLPIENLRKRYNCQVPSTCSFGAFRSNGQAHDQNHYQDQLVIYCLKRHLVYLVKSVITSEESILNTNKNTCYSTSRHAICL